MSVGVGSQKGVLPPSRGSRKGVFHVRFKDTNPRMRLAMEQWLKDKVEWYKTDEWLRTAECYILFRNHPLFQHLYDNERVARQFRREFSLRSKKIDFYEEFKQASVRHINRKALRDLGFSWYYPESVCQFCHDPLLPNRYFPLEAVLENDIWLCINCRKIAVRMRKEIAELRMWEEISKTQTAIGGFSAAINRPRVTRHRRAKGEDPETVA